MDPIHLSPEKEEAFPNLGRPDYKVTSDEDWVYNCIAHAADKNDRWWWPTTEQMEGVFWPPEVVREETVDAFVAAFATEGYVPCENAEFEVGFEKIAIYADVDGTPTHAAKQLSSGLWSSKLGSWENIEHKTLAVIGCQAYGEPVIFLKREMKDPPNSITKPE